MPKKTPCGKILLPLIYPLPMYAPSVKLVAAPHSNPSCGVMTCAVGDSIEGNTVSPSQPVRNHLPAWARQVLVKAEETRCPTGQEGLHREVYTHVLRGLFAWCSPRARRVAGTRVRPLISAADSSSAAAMVPLAFKEAWLPFSLYAFQPLAAQQPQSSHLEFPHA